MNSPACHTAQRRIQSLPTHLANQIAAGEVVERPASVVKELLENSMDAGARQITLDVVQGGAKLIRVEDDGTGIHPDDLPLATAPHATSKVYSQQELQQVMSLGFRGEALASIASVCRFSIASRPPEMAQGMRLDSTESAGVIPCAMSPGTRIEVRDLFYNTPARRKFLRTERTEYLHIDEVVRRLVLSRYDVGFKVSHNGRLQFNLTALADSGQREKRVAAVLGKNFLQHALAVEFEAAGMRLWGWVGQPGYSRSQADLQYFYLNGRMIRDKLITHALRQAHHSVLEPGRHPAYLLYLELDPQQVDVNVHPTKHEVRFRESRLVHDFLLRSLERSLNERAGPPTLLPEPPVTQRHGGTLEGGSATRHGIGESAAFYRLSLKSTASGTTSIQPQPALAMSQPLAVAHGAFLLMHRAGEVGVLDLRAARRLVVEGRFTGYLVNGELPGKPLLMPETVRMPEEAISRIERHADTLLRLGLLIERLGEEAVVLRQLPPPLRGIEAGAFIAALAHFLRTVPDPDVEQQAFLAAFARLVVPLLPAPDMTLAETLLRELEQLIEDGVVEEAALPWLSLTEERLAALFEARA